MARLTALPSIDIIRGFKGTIDFYLWRGLPCARKWPRRAPGRRTEAEIASSALFGQVSSNYRLLAPLALAAFQEAAKDQPRTARDLYISAVYGHLHRRTAPPPPPPPEEEMYDAYVCLRDLKPINTPGGDFLALDWRTRVLTQEQADTENICTLAGNQLTLPAGSYRCTISCPAYRVDGHQARLWDITNALLLLQGTSELMGGATLVSTRSFIAGRFTLAAPTTMEVQHRCQTTRAANGFGIQCNVADEIYTMAEFWRERPPT